MKLLLLDEGYPPELLAGFEVVRAPEGDVVAVLTIGAPVGSELFEAYYRGRVTVVSPIVATESLWGVALSLLLIRHSELVGRRVLAGAALIVAGSVLIGVYAG